MNELAFNIRPIQLKDIDGAIKLSTAEGWNQTENDWRRFIDNPGNVGSLAETSDRIIGTTTTMNYSNKVVWISMVLVDKDYRGHGVSKSLLQNILQQLQWCESIKLDATPAGQQVYKKFGFADEYRLARMTNLAMQQLPTQAERDAIPKLIQLTDISDVVAFDEKVFGVNRGILLESLIRDFPGKSWMMRQEDRITGVALGRDGSKYNHVGPVLAANTADAKILIVEALKGLTNKPVVIDVLCDKEELVNWFHSIGFTQQRGFTRMYKNGNPFPGMMDNQFLICGPEFG